MQYGLPHATALFCWQLQTPTQVQLGPHVQHGPHMQYGLPHGPPDARHDDDDDFWVQLHTPTQVQLGPQVQEGPQIQAGLPQCAFVVPAVPGQPAQVQ